MKQPFLLFFAFFIYVAQTVAQDTVQFTSALGIASGSRYGREAVYTDVLLWQLAANHLKKPVGGAVFYTNPNGQAVEWQAIEADKNGRFRVFSKRSFQRSHNPFLNPGAVDSGADYVYLTYQSDKETSAILNVMGANSLFFNGEPHMGDPYATGYMHIPVKIKKGLNEIYVRGGNILPKLIFENRSFIIHNSDLTLPDIVLGQSRLLKGALTVSNLSNKSLTGLKIMATIAGKTITTPISSIWALGMRKVIFEFDATNIVAKGIYPCRLSLLKNSQLLAQTTISVEAVMATSSYKQTFVSQIDGSLQYYAVTPQLDQSKPNQALFLSVHGAGVEAIGQAKAYKSKNWGTLVAATNRRPRGFNWEDWGRLDALEVLAIAKEKFKPNLQQIYLTGHSMGGHGTWFLGATYPDKWAAIAPAAGYASLKDYGSADGKIPANSNINTERLLLRAGNQSDVTKLASNYKNLGVYILHGDADKVVPVSYARQMRSLLSTFHPDFSYYEYPGGEHWFGDQSVDWPAIFSYFKWHQIKADTQVNHIDFTTANPGISASYRWATIYQQQQPLKYSRIQLDRDITMGTIVGHTQNVGVLRLALTDFATNQHVNIKIDSLDSLSYLVKNKNDTVFLEKEADKWRLSQAPHVGHKNPVRYAGFKEAFNHHMVFVVGTRGNAEVNKALLAKAKFDAESWYYRGNGAVDIITDKQFNTKAYRGRNVILYGNADNNAVWPLLLHNCPIQIDNKQVSIGINKFTGANLGAYFIWPQAQPNLLVGVVAATGLEGLKSGYANQYFAGGSGFPDFTIFDSNLPKEGVKGIKMAGFYNNTWQVDLQETAVSP